MDFKDGEAGKCSGLDFIFLCRSEVKKRFFKKPHFYLLRFKTFQTGSRRSNLIGLTNFFLFLKQLQQQLHHKHFLLVFTL